VLLVPAQQFTCLLKGGCCENHVIQKAWSQGPQTDLVANTFQHAVPSSHPEHSHTLPTSLLPCGVEEAEEITWLKRLELGGFRPAWQQTHAGMQFPEEVLSAFSPCPAIYLSVGGRKLWKACDLLQILWSTQQPTRAAKSQILDANYYTNHKLGALFQPWFSGSDSLLAWEYRTSNHNTLCYQSPRHCLNFSRTTLDLLPVHNHLSCTSPNQTLWQGVPRHSISKP
jgi:hypothetical protein